MSKQSSVDWLVRKLSTELIGEIPLHRWDEIREAVQQAKAMHKAEIMQTYSDGLGNGMHFERGDGSGKDLDEEQYYKDNFA